MACFLLDRPVASEKLIKTSSQTQGASDENNFKKHDVVDIVSFHPTDWVGGGQSPSAGPKQMSNQMQNQMQSQNGRAMLRSSVVVWECLFDLSQTGLFQAVQNQMHQAC
tara:strand:- start:5570 stop:5896 length:327 start_codon:yes stop_codon:yes gene_type:complete